MKIPFRLLPGSWGLKGKTRKIAQLEYELEAGEELDRELAKVEYEYDEKQLKLRNLELDLKYKRADEYDVEKAKLNLLYPDDKQKMLDLELKFEKISNLEYEKQTATLNHEPWVTVKDSKFNKNGDSTGFSIELDFNEYFIEMLKENGFEGYSDDDLVHEWFNQLCKQVALEEEIISPEDLSETFNKKNGPTVGPDGKLKYT